MSVERWRGLKALVTSAVEHGSLAIERVQKETARRPFAILERIPGIATPARGIHEIHDAAVTNVHEIIRLTARVVSETVDAALDASLEPDAEREPQGKQ